MHKSMIFVSDMMQIFIYRLLTELTKTIKEMLFSASHIQYRTDSLTYLTILQQEGTQSKLY